jgi:hypothetical protein
VTLKHRPFAALSCDVSMARVCESLSFAPDCVRLVGVGSSALAICKLHFCVLLTGVDALPVLVVHRHQIAYPMDGVALREQVVWLLASSEADKQKLVVAPSLVPEHEWIPDKSSKKCSCGRSYTLIWRRHHW